MAGTISRYYPPVDGPGTGRFAHLHGNRETILEPIDPEGTVSASFGVARFRGNDSVETWVARADTALYAAKSAGRNRVASD